MLPIAVKTKLGFISCHLKLCNKNIWRLQQYYLIVCLDLEQDLTTVAKGGLLFFIQAIERALPCQKK